MLIFNIDACLKFKIVVFSVYILVALVLYMKCVIIEQRIKVPTISGILWVNTN